MSREQSRQFLSKLQLFAVLFTLIIGRGILLIPILVTRHAEQDGWISILLAGLLSLILVNISLYAMKFFEDKTFIEISEMALGKYFGKIPGVLLVVYYVIFAALATRFIIDLASSWLLPQTPIEILMIILIGLCYYLCRNGIKVYGRFCQTLLWITFPAIPLILLPFLLQANVVKFLPVGGSGIHNILISALPGIYGFLGFESVVLLYPYVRKQISHKEIVTTCNVALLAVLFLKVYLVAGCIGIFGYREIQYFMYPVLEYFKILEFPVIERVEFVLIYFWLFIFFGAIVGLFRLATLGAGRLLKMEGYKNMALLLAIPVYFIAKMPQNVAMEIYYMDQFGRYSLGGLLIILTVVFGLALIRRRRHD